VGRGELEAERAGGGRSDGWKWVGGDVDEELKSKVGIDPNSREIQTLQS